MCNNDCESYNVDLHVFTSLWVQFVKGMCPPFTSSYGSSGYFKSWYLPGNGEIVSSLIERFCALIEKHQQQ